MDGRRPAPTSPSRGWRRPTLAGLVAVLVTAVLPMSPALAGAASSYSVTGTVDAHGIAVQFFRSTGGTESGPFELATSTTTDGAGRYSVDLPPGYYRVAFNELENQSPDSRIHGSTSQMLRITNYSVDLWDTTLPYRTSLLTGSLGEVCDNHTREGTIEAYAADDPNPNHAASWDVWTEGGAYSAHGFAGPTKFKITVPHHVPQWIGGDSFETARAFTLPSEEQTTGPDVFLEKTFDDTTAGRVSGVVDDNFTMNGVGGLIVRFYRSASGTPEGPWELATQHTSSPADADGRGRGQVQLTLPSGLYRITTNEHPDASAASRGYSSTAYQSNMIDDQDVAFEDADNVCVDDGDVWLYRIGVHVRGGTITGQVTDRRGKPLPGVDVSVFTDDTRGTAAEIAHSTTTDLDGTYQVQTIGGPAKVRFSRAAEPVRNGMAKLYRTQWSGGAADAAHATTVTVATGETSTLNTSLADAPISVQSKPRISGSARVGSTLSASPGSSSLDPRDDDRSIGTRKYQWLRTTGSRSVPIKGATKRTYRPTIKDAGHTLRFRVTYTAPRSYTGVPPVTATSKPSRKVMAEARVRASARPSGWHQFTITAKISIKGKKKPSGTAYVQWVRLKPKGDYLRPTGKVHTTKVRYSHGKLRYTVKTSDQGYWAYAVIVPDTSSIIGHYSSNYVELR